MKAAHLQMRLTLLPVVVPAEKGGAWADGGQCVGVPVASTATTLAKGKEWRGVSEIRGKGKNNEREESVQSA